MGASVPMRRLQRLSVTPVDAPKTLAAAHLPTRPCVCNAVGEGLHCETGPGESCGSADNMSLWDCFLAKTMCIYQVACHPKPGISLNAGCDQFRTEDSCNDQIHCQYTEDTSLVHSWGCQGLQNGTIQEYCKAVISKEECDRQQLCTWRLIENAERQCNNGGAWKGCIGKIDETTARCGSFTRSGCMSNNDYCSWVGACQCTPGYFGADCTEQVVGFNLLAPQGYCAEQQADKAVCQGLVYASSAADVHRCSEEGVRCGPWQDTKLAVSRIREVEIGDMIVDSLGILMLAVAGVFRFSNWNRYLFLASLANFMADMWLEAILVGVSAEAIEAVGTVRGSFCFSYGDGIASLIKLEELMDSIVTFAWTNIGLAIAGAVLEVVDTFSQALASEGLSMTAMFLVIFVSLSELGVGVASFIQNTQKLVEEIEFMEAVSLGLETFEDGHACFVRNVDLASAAVLGVEWTSHFWIVFPVWIVLPVSLVTFVYTLVICLACCCR
ncbi:unnamed protein product [Effrenium voratum]|nr:unnamed protein product [Effrenium voratum]